MKEMAKTAHLRQYLCLDLVFPIEEKNSYAEYAAQFTNLEITCIQLIEEKHKLDTYYHYKCSIPLVTQSNTRIGSLLSTAHQKGILSSLINILLLIHNSFVKEYTKLFAGSDKYAIDDIFIFCIYFLLCSQKW